jgi:hypothetical protein
MRTSSTASTRRPRRLGLRNHQGLPLSFVPQEALPDGTAYEEFIGATGGVPTRDNLHDFFNGLVWQTFPRIKRELNALQAAQIAPPASASRAGRRATPPPSSTRTPPCWWCATASGPARWSTALRATAGARRCIERRASSAPDAQVWLFGHALMEKLVAPRKAITAHTRVVFAGDDFFAWTTTTAALDRRARGAGAGCGWPQHRRLHAAAGAGRAGLVAGPGRRFL